MATATKSTPLEAALAQVVEHQATLGRWQAEAAAKAAELADVEARAGEEVLADESAADRLVETMAQLRSRVQMAERAAAAVLPKLNAAKRSAVLAEAKEWDAVASEHRRVLEVHDKQTNKLLDALRQHDGRDYVLSESPAGVDATGNRWFRSEKVGSVRVALAQAELRASTLREVGGGQDARSSLRRLATFHDGNIYGLTVDAYFGDSYGLELDAVIQQPMAAAIEDEAAMLRAGQAADAALSGQERRNALVAAEQARLDRLPSGSNISLMQD